MTKTQNICFNLSEEQTRNITRSVAEIEAIGLSQLQKTASIIRKEMPEKLLRSLEAIGIPGSGVNSIIIHGLFDAINPDQALLVHEAISRHICGINDIKYRYEDHKAIYPRSDGASTSEWGNGVGHISAHSDDLYENVDSDLLSLTVAHDRTACPTLIYNTDDLLSQLPEDDIHTLRTAQVRYRSGRNVTGVRLERIRPVIEPKDDDELYNIDMRVEPNYGDRMVAVEIADQPVLDRLRDALSRTTPISAEGRTGTFVIINNRKVLHSRGSIGQQKGYDHPAEASRLLFRSKGQKVQLQSVNQLF
ncbi:MAG: TauD/TfdA family dioxygenase [Marinobacterium sp.]|nr:TauD/TfdA family dioxygenase [Marinobacterium sp.]